MSGDVQMELYEARFAEKLAEYSDQLMTEKIAPPTGPVM